MRNFFTAIVLLAVGITASAQISILSTDDYTDWDTCDVVNYVVNYNMEFVKNVDKTPYKYTTDHMMLQIGGKATLFYSFDKYLADSANIEVLKRNGTEFSGNNATSWKLYKNYPSAGQYTLLEKVMSDKYACMEKVEEPAWQLVPDSTATIMGHQCNMAEADFRGRKWRAWYAGDIPLGEGPWKLCGLPGLILRACDSEQQYRFEITGIRKGRPGETLVYTGTKHEEIDKKSLNKLYKRYHDDPLAFFMATVPNGTITIQDEHGNKLDKMPAIPYNPIER